MGDYQNIIILAAIIEIIVLICFFVLCSDVNKIKKYLTQSSDFESKFKFLMSVGEKEKAREILINTMLLNSKIFSLDVPGDADTKGKKCFEKYSEELAALGIENPFKEENEETK